MSAEERELLEVAGMSLVLGWAFFRVLLWICEPSAVTLDLIAAWAAVLACVFAGISDDYGSW